MQVAMVSFLLEAGADVRAHRGAEEKFKDQGSRWGKPDDRPLLGHAALKGHVDVVRALIQRNCEGLDEHDSEVRSTSTADLTRT